MKHEILIGEELPDSHVLIPLGLSPPPQKKKKTDPLWIDITSTGPGVDGKAQVP